MSQGLASASAQPRRIFILAGQSNMAGRADPAEAPAYAHADRITVYAKSGRWVEPRDPVDDPSGQVDAVSRDLKAGFGPALPFADHLATLRPGISIGLVPCSKGGSSMDKWQPAQSRSRLYGSMLARAQEARRDGVIAGMIWYQGETDTTDMGLVRTWPGKFRRLVAAIQADLSQPDLPVVMTVIGPTRAPPRFRFWDEFVAMQLAMDLPHGVFRVSARDLGGLPDDPHLNAADYLEIGRRYAQAFDRAMPDVQSGADSSACVL